VLVVDEGAVGSDGLRDFFTGKNLTRPVEEHQEYLEGLGAEPDPDSLLTQFSG